MNGTDGSRRRAARPRLLLGGILAAGLAVLGLSGAGAATVGEQAGTVRAMGQSSPVRVTLQEPTTSTTSTTPTTSTTTTLVVPPAATEAPVAAPAPAAAQAPTATPAPAAAPEPAPAAEPEAAQPAPAATGGGSVEDAIAASFGDVYAKAVRVARCESSLNPDAVSRNGANWGLFQINVVHRARVEAMGYSWDQILDPYVNAAVARSIYDESGWGPWGCRGA